MVKQERRMRRTALARRTPLRSRPKLREREPGKDAWKFPVWGRCECCDEFSADRLHRHHILLERLVRRAGGDPWALVNSMLLCQRCHLNHHAASHRIPMEKVSDAAVEFAADLIGQDIAYLYFTTHYERGGEQ